MAAPPAVCLECGLMFPATAASFANGRITFQGEIGTNCPKCGGNARIINGTYDFVGGTIAAFRAPGVTRHKIERFRAIAESVKNGGLSAQQAAPEVALLSPALATVWGWTNANAGALGVLIAIITTFLMIYYEAESDAATVDAQTELTKQTQVLEKIHEELRRQNVVAPESLVKPPPTGPRRIASPPQKLVAAKPNRHERRKAASLERREGKRPAS